jgi:hypothetical protein
MISPFYTIFISSKQLTMCLPCALFYCDRFPAMVFLRTSRELVSLLHQLDEESGTKSIPCSVFHFTSASCLMSCTIVISSRSISKGHVEFHPPQATKRITIKMNKNSSIMVDPKRKKGITTMATETPSPSPMSPPTGTTTATAFPATAPAHQGLSTRSSATKKALSADAKSANKKLGTGPWVMARFYGTFINMLPLCRFRSSSLLHLVPNSASALRAAFPFVCCRNG